MEASNQTKGKAAPAATSYDVIQGNRATQELRLRDIGQLPNLHESVCVGDVNEDGKVDQADLQQIQRSFGKKSGDIGYDPPADLDRNGIVDKADLALAEQNLGCSSK